MSSRLYYLDLFDTSEDGWNNNTITILDNQNNILLDNITLLFSDMQNGINTKRYTIIIDSNIPSFNIKYNNIGFYPYENYYALSDNSETFIYASSFGESPESNYIVNNVYGSIITETIHSGTTTTTTTTTTEPIVELTVPTTVIQNTAITDVATETTTATTTTTTTTAPRATVLDNITITTPGPDGDISENNITTTTTTTTTAPVPGGGGGGGDDPDYDLGVCCFKETENSEEKTCEDNVRKKDCRERLSPQWIGNSECSKINCSTIAEYVISYIDRSNVDENGLYDSSDLLYAIDVQFFDSVDGYWAGVISDGVILPQSNIFKSEDTCYKILQIGVEAPPLTFDLSVLRIDTDSVILTRNQDNNYEVIPASPDPCSDISTTQPPQQPTTPTGDGGGGGGGPDQKTTRTPKPEDPNETTPPPKTDAISWILSSKVDANNLYEQDDVQYTSDIKFYDAADDNLVGVKSDNVSLPMPFIARTVGGQCIKVLSLSVIIESSNVSSPIEISEDSATLSRDENNNYQVSLVEPNTCLHTPTPTPTAETTLTLPPLPPPPPPPEPDTVTPQQQITTNSVTTQETQPPQTPQTPQPPKPPEPEDKKTTTTATIQEKQETATTPTPIPTPIPYCEKFNIPDSFDFTFYGYGKFVDEPPQQITMTRSGDTWSGQGEFPNFCSTFTITMTCESENERFVYSGVLSCCPEGLEPTLSPPFSSEPLLFNTGNTNGGFSFIYDQDCLDCYCPGDPPGGGGGGGGNECQKDEECPACKKGTKFQPTSLTIPIQAQEGAANPSFMVFKIPLVAGDEPCTMKGEQDVYQAPIATLEPVAMPNFVSNHNGVAPYKTGFEVSNVVVKINPNGTVTTSFDAALFYCGPNYDLNNLDKFKCQPERFNQQIPLGDINCQNCNIFQDL